nr:unnamed protein product [Callosobruchus analis]
MYKLSKIHLSNRDMGYRSINTKLCYTSLQIFKLLLSNSL